MMINARTLLVTGSNGDIGRDVVNKALAQGRVVFATIRNEAHKETFETHTNLHFILMHTDKAESIRQAFIELDRLLEGLPLDTVIHCAAIEAAATVEFMDPERLEQVYKVNTVGSLVVMQECFPRLRQSGGTLILTSSLWGRVSGPLVSAYSASKWALESLTDAARRETRGMGFHITLANIGAVKSRMLSEHVISIHALLDKAGEEERALYGHTYREHADMTSKFSSIATSVESVSKTLLVIANKRNPSPRYTIGKDVKALVFLDWLLPIRWMDALLGIKKPIFKTSRHLK
tara:strand:+ start:454 stop:1326 length:873 start_codon:yes stop_codon:yes gene_type:complete